jgi:hypothetical protein
MGNRVSPEARNRDLLSIFDIAAIILDGKMPASISVPVCLDEFIDWTEEATTMANCLAGSGAQVLPSDCDELVVLQPYLRRIATDGRVGSDEIVCQNDVKHFPASTFERTAFYDKHILVYIQAFRFNLTDAKPHRVAYSISGLDFCLYLKLLRRLSQLTELDGFVSQESSCHEIKPDEEENLNECNICMARPQETQSCPAYMECVHLARKSGSKHIWIAPIVERGSRTKDAGDESSGRCVDYYRREISTFAIAFS